MSSKKPFRSAPEHFDQYHQAKQRQQEVSGAAKILGVATLGGIALGCLVGLYQGGYLSQASSNARAFSASLGLTRRSTPKSGDYWSGCDDARAAGVTPLYSGEPGYKTEMDGDSDGIACEPYHGN
jgi:Excalibur calcium-binding domain